jgi:hypothetical protein
MRNFLDTGGVMLFNRDLIYSIDLSTRAKRRKAVSLVLVLLGRIHSAEWDNLGRFPHNLRYGRGFAKADYSLDIVADVIAELGDAY